MSGKNTTKTVLLLLCSQVLDAALFMLNICQEILEVLKWR